MKKGGRGKQPEKSTDQKQLTIHPPGVSTGIEVGQELAQAQPKWVVVAKLAS